MRHPQAQEATRPHAADSDRPPAAPATPRIRAPSLQPLTARSILLARPSSDVLLLGLLCGRVLRGGLNPFALRLGLLWGVLPCHVLARLWRCHGLHVDSDALARLALERDREHTVGVVALGTLRLEVARDGHATVDGEDLAAACRRAVDVHVPVRRDAHVELV